MTITVAGSKDEDGLPVSVDEVSLRNASNEVSYFRFDADGRIVSFTDSAGRFATLAWEDDDAVVVASGSAAAGHTVVRGLSSKPFRTRLSTLETAPAPSVTGLPRIRPPRLEEPVATEQIIEYEYSDVGVNECGRRVGDESAAVELRATRADASVALLRPAYRNALVFFGTLSP